MDAGRQTEKALAGDIPVGLLDEFDRQTFSRRYKGKRFLKKEVLHRFAIWWVSLSEQEQCQFMDANTPEASQSWKDIVSDLVRHVHAEYMAQQADAIVQDAIDASEKAKQAK